LFVYHHDYAKLLERFSLNSVEMCHMSLGINHYFGGNPDHVVLGLWLG